MNETHFMTTLHYGLPMSFENAYPKPARRVVERPPTRGRRIPRLRPLSRRRAPVVAATGC